MLRVRGLSFQYDQYCFCKAVGSKKRERVIQNLDMDVFAGEIFGYLGHNGAGKTTSIRCMSGELPTNCGTIQVRRMGFVV